MKTVVKSNDKRSKKKRRAGGIITGILCLAVLLFLLAGLSIVNEINRLQADLADQRASLEDSLNKSISAYMETKYLGATNDNGRIKGDIDFNELTDEEIQQILSAIMASLDGYLTDDVYNGASQLAVDKLKASINDAVNKALLSMGLSSSTLSDEITALVLSNIQGNLSDYKNQIISGASDLSAVSGNVYNLDNRISNLDNSIKGLKNGYDATINALKKTDEQLAARIDSILKGNTSSQSEYEAKISSLLNEMNAMQQTINNNKNAITNNYNDNNTNIQNVKNSMNASDEALNSKIDALQGAFDSYMNGQAIAGRITPRSDGGSGNKLILVVPD